MGEEQPPKFGLSEKQPQAINTGAHPAIIDLVKADLDDRDRYAIHKFGDRIEPFNGRDALIDAYQEVLDLAVYLRGEIYERSEKARLDALHDAGCRWAYAVACLEPETGRLTGWGIYSEANPTHTLKVRTFLLAEQPAATFDEARAELEKVLRSEYWAWIWNLPNNVGT